MQNDESAERVLRERRAPRLLTTAPTLTGLKLEVQEFSQIACTKYTKRFHVPSAPTLFELRCNDARCEHGGYDITAIVVRTLRSRETRGHGDYSCDGTTGKSPCSRRIHFELFAEYAASL
ncbi:MAG TPA: hypothetical protein VFX59_07710 [Polyangiales bacterium]|nr:hypothetical protein [Polyangiales bacterium]